MQFPESWLREFCNPPLSSTALAELLTMSGLEVEDARPAAPGFHGVVVAQVLSVQRHPNADRLSVCQVDVGAQAPLTIVCGAPNVRSGIKVPCALEGAVLPPSDDPKAQGRPVVIRRGELRGVESQGMLCSARELQLSSDHGGLLILDEGAPVGQDIRRHLALDDTLLTLKLTPNLAHGLSVFGVARELAALTGSPLNPPPARAVPATHADRLPVTVEAPDLCGRFSGRIVRNVNTRAPTPAWMVERLARCGQRSVTALVDISNYVMFESGQPSHIFDLDKIEGGLTVRWGRPGEQLKLLNGNTVDIDGSVGVIADARGVESLAGIMGGDATAVSDTTAHVYVEAAFWWPQAVAGRSRRFNFSTDAGHRFERGVDPAATVARLERVTQLILEICGGQAGPVDDQTLSLPARKPVTLRVARAARIIGMPVTQAQCEDVFRRLGLPFESEPGRLHVTPPSWRFDLEIEEDLIEEVIRLLGYASLPTTPPRAALTARVRTEASRSLDAVRHQMASLDYQETINFSFVDERWERELAGNPDPIRLVNPMASHMAVMRSSLLGSLVSVLRLNLTRRASRVRIFEIGRVFRRDAEAIDGERTVAGVAQPIHVAGLIHGPAQSMQWGAKERAADFYDLKGDVEALIAPATLRFVPCEHPAFHPGRSARIEHDGVAIGHLGELHPKWRQAYELPTAPLLFELDASAALARALPVHAPVQRQQSVWRDLSLVVGDRLSHDAVVDAIGAGGTDSVVRSALVFDVFKPAQATPDLAAGERSLSVRLELLDDAVTLTDERIDQALGEVVARLTSTLGARMRA